MANCNSYMLLIVSKLSNKWLKVEAISPEKALDIAKDWASKNIVNLDYTVEVYSCKPTTNDPYDTFCLKAEFHFPTDEVEIPAEKFFKRSKKSKTFYVYIYLDDGKLFIDLNYKADNPDQAFEKAKTYMARAWPEHEIYRAVVKEKGNPQVLLDRVVSQESAPEEAEVRKETSSNFFEEESSSEDEEDAQTHQRYYMLYIACETDFRWLKVEAASPTEALEIGKDWGFKHFHNVQFIVEVHDSSPETGEPIAKSSFDFFFSEKTKKTSNSTSKVGNSTHFEKEEKTPATPDEVENSDTKKIYRIEVYIGKYLFHVGGVVVATPEEAVQTAKRFMSTYGIHHGFRVKVLESKTDKVLLDVEIYGKSSNEEAETLKDISNATNLYHAANDLIQISKQLTEVANSLLTSNEK